MEHVREKRAPGAAENRCTVCGYRYRKILRACIARLQRVDRLVERSRCRKRLGSAGQVGTLIVGNRTFQARIFTVSQRVQIEEEGGARGLRAMHFHCDPVRAEAMVRKRQGGTN